jgi:hypothetical protein
MAEGGIDAAVIHLPDWDRDSDRHTISAARRTRLGRTSDI